MYTPPSPPDYRLNEHWAALPFTRDTADIIPPQSILTDQQEFAVADVFYLHPTTYVSRSGWNQPLQHWLSRYLVCQGALQHQAPIFNGVGRVYAPFYRQMNMVGFVAPEEVQVAGLAIAYQDVRAAFEYYMKHWNNGRPIILAGHSQGSRHALRLLEELFEHKPLRKQLVAAYLAGAQIWDGKYVRNESDIVPCSHPTQTHCVAGWVTIGEGGDGRAMLQYEQASHLARNESALCVNPITWRMDGTKAPRSAHRGAYPLRLPWLLQQPLDEKILEAQCRDGVLWVSDPRKAVNHLGYSFAVFPGKNFHTYDSQLFWMDIRVNAQQRLDAFLAEGGM